MGQRTLETSSADRDPEVNDFSDRWQEESFHDFNLDASVAGDLVNYGGNGARQFPAFDPERIFMLGDADLDGRLSLDEYRDFLRSGPRMRDIAAAIEQMFKRLDSDCDGFLSLAEYRKSFPTWRGGPPVRPDTSKVKPPGTGAAEMTVTSEREQFFEAKIRPVLATHCISCHGPAKQKAGLRLDSADGIKTISFIRRRS